MKSIISNKNCIIHADSESFNRVTKQKIPKIIHQTGPDTIPHQFKSGINKLKLMNPEYEYLYWKDADIDNYISLNCSEREQTAYNSINPAYGPARADFFRYIIIRDKGGVYLDLKSSAVKPFRQIIKPNDEYLLSSWSSKRNGLFAPQENIVRTGFGEYCNWFIIGVPNHPFLHATIDRCITNIENYKLNPDKAQIKRYKYPSRMVGKTAVLHLTGPIAYTRAIKSILNTSKTSPPHTFKYQHYGGDLLYTTTAGTLNYLKHADYFKKHYSTLTEPVCL